MPTSRPNNRPVASDAGQLAETASLSVVLRPGCASAARDQASLPRPQSTRDITTPCRPTQCLPSVRQAGCRWEELRIRQLWCSLAVGTTARLISSEDRRQRRALQPAAHRERPATPPHQHGETAIAPGICRTRRVSRRLEGREQ